MLRFCTGKKYFVKYDMVKDYSRIDIIKKWGGNGHDFVLVAEDSEGKYCGVVFPEKMGTESLVKDALVREFLPMGKALFRCEKGLAYDYLNKYEIEYAPIMVEENEKQTILFCYDDDSEIAKNIMRTLDYLNMMRNPEIIFEQYGIVNIIGHNEVGYVLGKILKETGAVRVICDGEYAARFGFETGETNRSGYVFFAEGHHGISIEEGAYWKNDQPRYVWNDFIGLIQPWYISKASFGIEYREKMEEASDIEKRILSGKPFCAGRLGGTESHITRAYDEGKNYATNHIKWLYTTSGFFSAKKENQTDLDQYSKMTIEAIKKMDIHLSCVASGIGLVNKYASKVCIFSKWGSLFCFNTEDSIRFATWVNALASKKVLVISSVPKTIRKQYLNKAKIFHGNIVLPDFELLTYSMPETQNSTGKNKDYLDFFYAYNKIISDIKKIDFDIALISAGAYGYPMAADIAKMGKQAIELCSALYLMFGIKTKRHLLWPYANELWNEFWSWPIEDVPAGYMDIENGCYWR